MQVTRILSTLTSYLKELDRKGGEGAVIAGDLLAMNGMDQVNFFKLQRYLNESKLARKVEGYVVHIETKEQEKQHKKHVGESISNVSIPTLTHIQGFLLALTNPSAEGRIFYGKMEDKKVACFRYMLLDPAHHFKEIVEEARAVILAGGTMEPVEETIVHSIRTNMLTISGLDERLHDASFPVPTKRKDSHTFVWTRHTKGKLGSITCFQGAQWKRVRVYFREAYASCNGDYHDIQKFFEH